MSRTVFFRLAVWFCMLAYPREQRRAAGPFVPVPDRSPQNRCSSACLHGHIYCSPERAQTVSARELPGQRGIASCTGNEVILLRHGESLLNWEGRFTGWADVDLSPRGIEEAPPPGGVAPQRRRVHVPRCLDLGPETGHPDALDRHGRPRSHVRPGAPVVAAEREELRRPAGLQNTQEATRENGVEMVHLWRRTVTCGRRRSHGTIPATRD